MHNQLTIEDYRSATLPHKKTLKIIRELEAEYDIECYLYKDGDNWNNKEQYTLDILYHKHIYQAKTNTIRELSENLAKDIKYIVNKCKYIKQYWTPYE